MSLDELVDEGRELSAAATPGPWIAYDRGVGYEIHRVGRDRTQPLPRGLRTDLGDRGDAELIAWMRNSLEGLLTTAAIAQANADLALRNGDDAIHWLNAYEEMRVRAERAEALLHGIRAQVERKRPPLVHAYPTHPQYRPGTVDAVAVKDLEPYLGDPLDLAAPRHTSPEDLGISPKESWVETRVLIGGRVTRLTHHLPLPAQCPADRNLIAHTVRHVAEALARHIEEGNDL